MSQRAQTLHWGNITWFTIVHSLGFAGFAYALVYAPWQTAVLAIVLFFLCHLSIRTGLHSYYSHRAWKPHPVVEYVLLILAALVFQGLALWWTAMHRIHHRHEDTALDPHSPKVGGLWWAHVGWLLYRESVTHPELFREQRRLVTSFPRLQWQARNYTALSFGFGIIAPAIIAGVWWGDLVGGLLVAGFAIGPTGFGLIERAGQGINLMFERSVRQSKPLPDFIEALGEAFARRRDQLSTKGRAMPGAQMALAAVAGLESTVQSVVTGTIMANAVAKLSAFGLDGYLDLSIGGFGSEHYPKASLIQFTRMRASEAHGVPFPESGTVYITDSVRDVEAAVIGHATPIAVVSGSSSESQLRAAGAKYVLDDLTVPRALVDAVLQATSSA
jgi:phosphoglycolate phosphatase